MRLVLQKADGDCGLCALATLLELPYEDVYIAAAKVDPKYRGKNGLWMTTLMKVARQLDTRLVVRKPARLDEREGVLRVQWKATHPNRERASHYVAVAHGVVVDSTDGLILPVDEYLLRETCIPGPLLEIVA